MKLSDIKRDVSAIEAGAWVGKKYGTPIPGMGDLCIKTRGVGNADWRAMEAKLIGAVPMQKRISGLSPEDRDAITGACLLDAGVTDWDGVEDDDEKPVPYSRPQSGLFFTDRAYAEFRDAALWAANIVGTAAAAALGADVKNSQAPSAGN